MAGTRRRSVLLAAMAVVAGLTLPAMVSVAPAGAVVAFGTRAETAMPSKPWWTTTADMNGDGKTDAVVPSFDASNVSVLTGSGTGTFTRADYPTGNGPTGAAVGYFDADARLDVVTSNQSAGTVSVLRGATGGGLGVKTDYTAGTNPFHVAAGDVNADAKVDIVTANYGSNNVSVLLGTGLGTFGAKTDFATSANPRTVALSDVNGDGRVDIVAATQGNNGVSVLLGTGTSSLFSAKIDATVGTAPYGVAVADVNADGKPDVVTANSAANSVSVLLGNGNGTFAAKTDYAMGTDTRGVAVGDINGDGKPDIVAANYGGASLSVREGTGTGTFGSKTDLATPNGPFGVSLADFNGDGQLDIVNANLNAASVSRFLNTTPASPPTITGSRSPAANANGWNNESVVASFTCGGVNLSSCTSPVTVSADGASQSVTGTATNAAGQTATATVSNINIDKTLPSLSGVAASPPNAAGWYRDTVGIDWTCTDALSGIATGSCPTRSYPLGEGSAVTMSRSVTDKAGNQRTASSQPVKIDYTRPSTGVSSPPTWSKTDVTLTLSPVDATSGVAATLYKIDGGATQTGTAPVVSGQGTHTVQYWSVDVAGNTETTQSVQVRIDVQAPSITASRSVPANAAGWNNGPVTVTFTCGDEAGGSGVASCSPPQSYSTEVDTTATGNATDVAGNSASVQAPVRIDQTAPTVTAQVPAANAHGWFNEPVEVPFSCVDLGGSGVATCPAPIVFGGEGADQPVTATGSDLAGNEGTATGSTVSLDTTAPTLSGAALNEPNGSGGYYGDVLVRWSCDDALSGFVACPADVTVTGEGVHEISRSVTDRAGNTTTAQVSIRIDHDPSTDPGIVHGTIADQSNGGPVAGATVMLRSASTNAVIATTTTGTDGTYTFPMVADGSYRIYAVLNKAYQGAYSSSTFAVAHGTSATVDQALAPTLVIAGTVRTPSGTPISGATVRVSPSSLAAITDASGNYRIPGNLPGPVTVRFYGYGSVPSAPTSFNLTADRVLDQALTPAAPGSGVKGTVTASTGGAPLAGATVRVYPKDSAVFGITVTTGADGRYSLASLPAGTYELDVIRPDYQVRWFGDSLSRTGAAPVGITTECTATPDAAWGDACAFPANVAIRR